MNGFVGLKMSHTAGSIYAIHRYCLHTLRLLYTTAQVVSPIYMIYVVSFDVAEKRSCVIFCFILQGYALDNNGHNIAEGPSVRMET